MKIAFIIPPSLDNLPPAERIFGCNYGLYPQVNIFILYPATILKNAGYDITFFDFPAENKSVAQFKDFCNKNDYDVFIFYTVFLSKRNDIAARNMLIKSDRNVKFIFMATEPTATPEDFVTENSIVIRGEPESRILPVLKALEKNEFEGILGISHMKDGKIENNPSAPIIEDLDLLPYPDRSLLNQEKYFNPKLSAQPFTTMLASRGCSFKCYYCVPNSLDFSREIEFKRESRGLKPPARLRSAKNVIEEFNKLADSGYKSISFLDDQFVWGDKRTIEICKGIERCNVEWSCLARADMLQNEKTVSAMAASGCRFVAMGIESFNQEILDYIGKDCKVELFYSAIRNLKKFGVEVELNILLGASPLENRNTIAHTFSEVLKIDPDYALFSICTPFPYTSFNEKAKKEGWMVGPEYEAVDPMRESFISYPHLKKTELERIIKQLYLRYYFRPRYLVKKMKMVRTLRDLVNKIKVAQKIFGFRNAKTRVPYF